MLLMSMLLLTIALIGCSNSNGSSADSDLSQIEQIKERDKLIVGVKYDLFLFGLKNPLDNKVEGFEIDLMKALAKDLLGDEDKIEFKEVNSKTRIDMLKNGDVDLVAATMTITDERKKVVDFSEPYLTVGQTLLVPVNSQIEDIKDVDVKDKVVVTAKGSVVGNIMKAEAPNAQVREYENFGEAFTALKSGKGDALMTHNSIQLGMIKQSEEDGEPTFKIVGDPVTREDIGLAFHKGNDELVEYANTFIEKIKQDGTFDELYDKWFGEQQF